MRRAVFIPICVALALAACGSGQDPTVEGPAAAAVSSATVATVGESTTSTATATESTTPSDEPAATTAPPSVATPTTAAPGSGVPVDDVPAAAFAPPAGRSTRTGSTRP